MTTRTLETVDFSRMLGFDTAPFLQDLPSDFSTFDLRYRPLAGPQRDQAVLEMVKEVFERSHDQAGPHRLEKWESGWADNLSNMRKSGFNLDSMQPGYCRYTRFRLNDEIVESRDPHFETHINIILRHMIFRKWLGDYSRFVEFGCGTGTSQTVLAKLFPSAELHATDWTEASVKIVELMSQQIGRPIHASRLDMFNPEAAAPVPGGREAGFITCHSLEQLGTDFEKFLRFTMKAKPGLCLHLEPFLELYDSEVLLDWLAASYHRKRNYLAGWLPALERLEHDGQARILEKRRLRFGSLFHEGYSLVVWQPI